MILNKFKYLILITSYSFFAFLIIVAINAVVPDQDTPIFEEKQMLIKKIDNNFQRDKNSVYEILENNFGNLEKEKEEESAKPANEVKKSLNSKETYRLQFASFKKEQKSVKIAKQLQDEFDKYNVKIEVTTKEVMIQGNQIFYRILSKEFFSFNQAKDACKIAKKNKINCIIIRE